ncbi:two-component system sensor histidine kinase BaeS [Xenorhabdus anantnagensis]|uniref:histidine kinase n=1 Tax=Xenorhabdus anantnagensis TaxID=3025875 RepID=A0ABT5LMQ7_9GAMM|nr:two-component system sensor histidine kinase BaeS [Xenorhabdus anantnagensis]
MKTGIRTKLFLAIFATCMLVLVTMHWGVHVSFQHSFIGYIKQNSRMQANRLAEALTEQYQKQGNWHFLTQNDRAIFQIIRTIEQDNDLHQKTKSHGLRPQFWIVDAQMNRLVGHSSDIPARSYRKSVTYQNKTVGWVIVSPSDKITRQADISFAHQQQFTSWVIAGFSTLLALIATFLFSRGLLRPVKRLVEGTHKLAAGDFTVRVIPSSKDEIGKLASDFNQLASTLEKNEQMRRDYMADISHELRTPLSVLRGELEALQDGLRKPTQETIHSLLTEVATLTKLVDDLHLLSLSNRGSLAYRKESINVSELLQISVANYHSRFADKQISLELNLKENVTLFADPNRLTQLFHNLLENSLRYTNKHGKVIIRGHSDQQKWIFDLQDSAPGLTVEQCQRVFERFYRCESSRNRASGGSGLGLAICYNIVEAHDGIIRAEISPLGGIKIHVVLPLIKSSELETCKLET